MNFKSDFFCMNMRLVTYNRSMENDIITETGFHLGRRRETVKSEVRYHVSGIRSVLLNLPQSLWTSDSTATRRQIIFLCKWFSTSFEHNTDNKTTKSQTKMAVLLSRQTHSQHFRNVLNAWKLFFHFAVCVCVYTVQYTSHYLAPSC